MKKILFILASTTLLISCNENSQELKTDIENLKLQKTQLQNDLSFLQNKNDSINSNLTTQTEKYNDLIKENKILSSGKLPKYVLKLNLRQIHYSLSIKKQIADAVNTVDFEVPVDKEYYDNVSIGSEILDNFRMGSLIFKGSFGNWRIKVTDKQIQE